MKNIETVLKELRERLNDPEPVICGGEPKSFESCETGCERYHRCDTIAITDDYIKAIELIISTLNGEVPAEATPVLAMIFDFLHTPYNNGSYGLETLIYKVQQTEEYACA